MCWSFVCRKPCKWLAPVFEVCREQHNEKPHRVCHRRVGNISVVTMTSFQPGIHTWFESGMPYLDKEKCISLVQVWNAVVWLWWSELWRWDFFPPQLDTFKISLALAGFSDVTNSSFNSRWKWDVLKIKRADYISFYPLSSLTATSFSEIQQLLACHFIVPIQRRMCSATFLNK